MTVIANPPIWQQNRQYSARLDRTVVDLIFTEGVVDIGGGDFEVIETSPLSLSVAVAVGRAVIQGDDETRQGKYLIVSDGVVNVAITAAPVSPNSRIDRIVIQVNDPVAGSVRTPANVCEIVAIAGTPGLTPVAPALPATAISLATVAVATGATTIANADITDLRTAASNEAFTITSNFEILTTAERNALTPYAGQVIFNSDTNLVQYYDGSGWLGIGGLSLDDLTDVTITSVTEGQGLVYDSGTSQWVNRTLQEDANIVLGMQVFL